MKIKITDVRAKGTRKRSQELIKVLSEQYNTKEWSNTREVLLTLKVCAERFGVIIYAKTNEHPRNLSVGKNYEYFSFLNKIPTLQ